MIRRLREGFSVYLRGPLGKQVFVFLMISFIGTPKRLIGTPPGPRRGEEEEERRRGGHISFARARYLEDGLAQSFARTHDTNTEHDFPVSSLNLRFAKIRKVVYSVV